MSKPPRATKRPTEKDLNRIEALWREFQFGRSRDGKEAAVSAQSGTHLWAYSKDGALSPEQEDLLVEMAAQLGDDCAFASPVDLAAWLQEDFVRVLIGADETDKTDEIDDDASEAELLAWARSQEDHWKSIYAPVVHQVSFSVRRFPAADGDFDVALGGECALALKSLKGVLRFSGVIQNAVTRTSAILRAANALEEIVGAGYSLGVLELRRMIPGVTAGHAYFDEFSREGVTWLPHRDESDDEDEAPEGAVPVALPEPTARIWRGVLSQFREEPSELELRRRSRGEASPEVTRRFQSLQDLFGSDKERAIEIRNAARLLARAATEGDPGVGISTAVICLEALLLEKNAHSDVTSRLAEAVAYRIGGSHERREDLRAEIKRLYNTRSMFAHTGRVEKKVAFSADRKKVLELAGEVLRREIEEFMP